MSQKLAVGQFIEYRDGSKRYGWAVVGEEDGAFWMKVPGRGVQEVHGKMLAMGGSKMNNRGTFLLDMSAADINKGAREDVTVKAGKFSAFRSEILVASRHGAAA